MKTLKLFFISFLLLIAINFVSALTLNTFWLENNQNIISVSNGESATIVMEIGDIQTSTSLFIDIALNGNSIYNNIVDPIGGTFETIYTVTQEDYNNQIGQYQVSVQVYDADNGELKTNYLELNVIQAENTAPYFDDLPNLYLNKNSGFNNNLLNLEQYAHDNENDPLTFTIVSETNTNVVDCSIDANNYLDCNVIDNMVGNSILTLGVSDGELSDTESFTVYVQEGIENILPTINIIKPVENEVVNGIYNILWVATDPNQEYNTLDIKIEYQPYAEILSDEWVVLENLQDNNDGIFEWDTINIENDQYILKITARDDENAFSDDTVIFFISDILENTSPVVEIIKPTETETISGLYNIEWNAIDNEQASNTLDVKVEYKEENWWFGFLSYFGFDNNWILIYESENNPGEYLWNTMNVDNNYYKLRITVTDDGNLSDEDEVLFEIDNQISINHDPIITSTPVTIAYVNQLYSYDVNAIDIDGDILTYLFDSPVPDGMSINSNTGLITWTPTQIGNYPVEVKVIDNNGGEDTQEFTINVLSEEPVPPVVPPVVLVGLKRHKFLLSNIITKEKENYLDVYVNINSKGSYKENMELKAVIIQTGDIVYDNFNLDVHDGYWRFLRFNKPLKGNYVIRVEANSNEYNDIKFVTVKI